MDYYLNYLLRRDEPLSRSELAGLQELIEAYNGATEIPELVIDGGGELFKIDLPDPANGIVVQGKVQLPVDLWRRNVYDFSYVMDNWLALLSEMRKTTSGGIWQVDVDGVPMHWNSDDMRYEPPSN